MNSPHPLAPRYRLDDQQPWLVGIDPIGRYWIAVNGDAALMVAVAGLQISSFDAFHAALLFFRRMAPGEQLELPAATGLPLEIHCISENYFAVAGQIQSQPVFHLFDREALESLLMTAHPDWQCAPQHVDLGRRMLALAWEQPSYHQAA